MNINLREKPKSRHIYVIILMLIIPMIGIARNNPIMIINCEGVTIVGEDPEALAAMVTVFPCDMNGACPTGTVPFDNMGTCECVPDCSMLVPYDPMDCSSCDLIGGSTWQQAPQVCGCVDISINYDCGCPPWFSPMTDVNMLFIGCEIPDVPCFDGDITFDIAGECGIPDDASGLVTTTVTINVPIIGDGSTVPGYALTLTDLQNCELTSGENFVEALADEYGAEAAFVDDDNDGEIILEFLRNPNLPTIINFNNDNQDILILSCVPIPTMGTWALVVLGFLMVIIGLVVVKRKTHYRFG